VERAVVIKALSIALVAIAVVFCAIVCALNPAAQVGAALGLLVGGLLGPLRVAGVDFRQWFRDPGEPADWSDDSPYGLVRSVFGHASGAAAFFAAISCLIWLFSPGYRGIFARPLYTLTLNWAVDQHWTVGAAFITRIGRPNWYWFLPGVAAALVVAQALVELVWRVGLSVLPDPRPPKRFLAPAAAPQVRPLAARNPTRRRLIVCCDGTWNWPDGQRETNVVRLLRAIAPTDGAITQIAYYHLGVGTGNIVDRIAGGGAGVGISLSVKACYGFITDNYVEGDEIFLFGFSRGAFVARSLGGMIGTVGVLQKSEMARFIEVWDWYSQPKDERDRNSAALRTLAPNRHQNVEVECIGVWDTVGALGIPGTRFCAKAFAFYETELGTHVRHAFQALAIDERRGNFQAAVWVPYTSQRQQSGEAPPAAALTGPAQVLKQVWFPGVHANVGGGYERHGLSDTSFLWMLAQIDAAHLLALNAGCIGPALDASEPYPTGSLPDSRTLFWRLISSPVPRPVCLINAAERVHESAFRRGLSNNPYPVAANDIYRRPARSQWLQLMAGMNPTRQIARMPFEQQNAVIKRQPPVPSPPRVPKNIGFCGRLLQFVGGNG
jgi:hypothetical protein